MNLFSLITLFFLLFASVGPAGSSQLSHSKGFYAGYNSIGVSRKEKTHLDKIDYQDGEGGRLIIENKSLSKKNNHLNHGLFVGYSTHAGNLFSAIEGAIESHNVSTASHAWPSVHLILKLPPASSAASPTSTRTCAGPAPDPLPSDSIPAKELPPVNYTVQTRFERGYVFSVAPKIGVYVSQGHLVYLKVGIELSRNKLISSYSLQGGNNVLKNTKTNSAWQITFVPGVGYQVNINKHFFVRAEYNYNLGNTLKSQPLVDNVTITPRVTYHSHIAKVGIGCYW